ncbi:hypothetical protein Tco_1213835 [Tanacetum coccineum]
MRLRLASISCPFYVSVDGNGTATMFVTCFSDQANTLIRDCNDILAELPNKDPHELLSALKDLEGTTHVFQFHFDSESISRRRDLVLDRVFKSAMLPLPAPPPQVIPYELIIKEQPRATQVSEPTLPSSTLPPQTTAAAPISEDQPEATQPPKLLSLVLSTTTSNQPEVVKPETGETEES